MADNERTKSEAPGGDASPLSREEFAERVRVSFRVFWGIAVGIVGEASLAEDVVQEATIIGMGKLDQFQKGTSFNAWMGTIVRYVALNHARKERKRRPTSADEAMLEGMGNSGREGGSSSTGRFDARLAEALHEVNDVARACLILRTVEDLGYNEISELLGIPAGTAMSHVHRTRKLLREKLAGFATDDIQDSDTKRDASQ